MKLHNITIIIIIVSMVVLGCITFLSDLGDNYGTTADLSSFNKTAQRLNRTQQTAQSLSDEIYSFKLESVTDFFMIPYKMIKIGWKVARTIFSSWITVGVIIGETAETTTESGIPLPSWLVPSIISIIAVILVSIIVYAFFKWKFED